jgi:hypothetical protein
MERRHLATGLNGLRAAADKTLRRRHRGGEVIDAYFFQVTPTEIGHVDFKQAAQEARSDDD